MQTQGSINLNDIHSFTEFLRNAKDYTALLKETGRPSVLTVNGKAEIVVQDARSYQILLDRLAELEDLRAVRQGIAEMKAGDGEEMDEVFDRLDAKYLPSQPKSGKRK